MKEDLEQCKMDSLSLCDRLLALLKENQEDACSFFGGEAYQDYDTATEKAKNKVRKIRSRIRNL